MSGRNPIEDLAHLRHEFGEHGGVNMSIEASSTFTVIDPETMPDLFQGRAHGFPDLLRGFRHGENSLDVPGWRRPVGTGHCK